jgi:hypothetical protein
MAAPNLAAISSASLHGVDDDRNTAVIGTGTVPL